MYNSNMEDPKFEVTIGRPKLKDYKALSDGMLSYVVSRKTGSPQNIGNN